jgi:hypothetical protein
MEDLRTIIDEVAPTTVVEIGVADPADAWGERLAPDAARVQLLTSPLDQHGHVVDLASQLDDAPDVIIVHQSDDPAEGRDRFEALFPAVRPGGVYVIVGAVTDGIALDLTYATAAPELAVEQVHLASDVAVVRRGTGDLVRGQFRLADEFPIVLPYHRNGSS